MQKCIKGYCLELVSQVIDEQSKQKIKSFSVFIGAGCSSEYGLPTTFDLALKTILDENNSHRINEKDIEKAKRINEKNLKYLETKQKKFKLSDKQYNDIIAVFKKFIKGLDENYKRAFFIKELRKTKDSFTYKLLVNLWEQQYINHVITTNFDDLILQELNEKQDSNSFERYTYNDFKDNSFIIEPDKIITKYIFVQIAGDLGRNMVLWESDDFETNITAYTQKILSKLIQNNPIILIGYNANEYEIQSILQEKCSNHLTIVNRSGLSGGVKKISEDRNLNNNTLYVPSNCSLFFQELTNAIYEKTQDNSLLYAFERIKKQVHNKIIICDNYNINDNRLVIRDYIESTIKSFLDNQEKTLILEGNSGNGKSYYLQYLSIRYNNIDSNLFIYITASSIPYNKTIFEYISDNLEIPIAYIKHLNNKKIVFIIDGLNESNKALSILQEIETQLTKKETNNIKYIISVRTEFWNNLASYGDGNDIINKHQTFNNIVPIHEFTKDEMQDAIKRYNLSVDIKKVQNKNIYKLLKNPFYLFLISKINITDSISSLNIFEIFFDKVFNGNRNYIDIIYKLCLNIYSSQSIIIEDFEKNLQNKLLPVYEELVNIKILKDIYSTYTTFFYDKMGEYLFAKIFLQNPLEEKSKIEIIKSTLKNIENCNNLSFKIFLLNSLRYFLSLLNIDEIKQYLNHQNPIIQSLVREALSERGKFDFEEKYLDDPFLLSISLSDTNNHQKIYDTLIKKENLYLSSFPINMISSREPATLKRFILFMISTINDFDDERYRNNLILIFNSILVYVMKNGINQDDVIIFKKLNELISNFNQNYICSIIENVFFDNLKYLFYGSNDVKVDEFFEINNKHLFEKAINKNIYEISIEDLKTIIIQNMTSWIITMILFFRDRNHTKFEETIDTLFRSGIQRYQDFVLTLLGHLSKFDKKFLKLLQKYTYDMKRNYPNIYNAKTISNDNEDETQFDPMVPLISTNIHYNKDDLIMIFSEILELRNENDIYSFSRLLYKIAIDYPSITIQIIYEKNILNDEKFKDYRIKVIEILNSLRYFYPDIFWEETKKYKFDNIFLFLEKYQEFNSRTISEIHDWHWFNIFNFIFTNNEEKFNKTIRYMLNFNSFYDFICGFLHQINKK